MKIPLMPETIDVALIGIVSANLIGSCFSEATGVTPAGPPFGDQDSRNPRRGDLLDKQRGGPGYGLPPGKTD
jgi:hypothetical protein